MNLFKLCIEFWCSLSILKIFQDRPISYSKMVIRSKGKLTPSVEFPIVLVMKFSQLWLHLLLCILFLVLFSDLDASDMIYVNQVLQSRTNPTLVPWKGGAVSQALYTIVVFYYFL